ncbi:MAG: prepilin-type N-terminal cleavage/methylation domain-containing protein [Planctomycetota bacterium]
MIPLRYQKGFTILEILLAVVILTVGLLGLLAVFPIAMRSGKKAVETTNAVIIAQSVEQAIRDGLSEHKAQSADGRWTYFIFSHDGVTDTLPSKISQARPDSDYYILLPSPDPDRKGAMRRSEYWERGKTFVFPESDGLSWVVTDEQGERDVSDDSSSSAPNGRGDPTKADDDGDDYTRRIMSPDGLRELDSYETYDVRRVYQLSNRFFDQELADDYNLTDDDPISQYSFAFTLRPAQQDGSLDLKYPDDPNFVPSGELFEAEILIFRSFKEGTNYAVPFYQSQILVHK